MKIKDPSYIDTEDKNSSSKASELSRYSQPMKEHINPLLYNKGNARASKDFVKKPTLPTESMCLPEYNHHIAQTNYLSPVITQQWDILKKESISSVGSDGALSNTEEFDFSDNALGVSNFIKPPLFEVNNTMQLLLQAKKVEDMANEKKIDNQLNGKEEVKMPYKSRSMFQQKTESIEALAADLTPEQYNFLKTMYEFKCNYLFHTLNMREVYFQYVSVSNSKMSFASSEEFLKQVSALLSQKKNYLRDFSQYGRKTLS